MSHFAGFTDPDGNGWVLAQSRYELDSRSITPRPSRRDIVFRRLIRRSFKVDRGPGAWVRRLLADEIPVVRQQLGREG